MSMEKEKRSLGRPTPPEDMFSGAGNKYVPSQTCKDWIFNTFINRDSALFNKDHEHLQSALIGVVWAYEENLRQMARVVGQAESPQLQGSKWVKGRAEQQLVQWFGDFPDFILTFDAEFARTCSDTTWCALVEHELYHCAQKLDEYGGPKFRKDGTPSFGIRAHDVEEFVGVVERYGVAASSGKVRQLVDAALKAPSISQLDIDASCGTCNFKI